MEYLGRIAASETGWEDLADEYYYRLPEDVQWHAAQCGLEELSKLYHRCGTFHSLSGGTGRVSESARRVTQGQVGPDSERQVELILGMVSNFSSSRFRPLTLGTNDLESGPFNILEGNCRAVALEILRERGQAPFSTVNLFLATSESERVRVWI